MPRPAPKTVKRCPDCKEVKAVEDFYFGRSYDGGFSPYCKSCSRARNNGRWPADREKMRRIARESYHRHKHRHRIRVYAKVAEYRMKMQKDNPAKWRSKKFFDVVRENVAPDVTKEFIESLLKHTTHCQCCGDALDLAYLPREGRKYRSNQKAPSIDRVNNDRGYTRSNIAVICWECNYRKTDLTVEDLEMLLQYMRKYGDFRNEL